MLLLPLRLLLLMFSMTPSSDYSVDPPQLINFHIHSRICPVSAGVLYRPPPRCAIRPQRLHYSCSDCSSLARLHAQKRLNHHLFCLFPGRLHRLHCLRLQPSGQGRPSARTSCSFTNFWPWFRSLGSVRWLGAQRVFWRQLSKLPA